MQRHRHWPSVLLEDGRNLRTHVIDRNWATRVILGIFFFLTLWDLFSSCLLSSCLPLCFQSAWGQSFLTQAPSMVNYITLVVDLDLQSPRRHASPRICVDISRKASLNPGSTVPWAVAPSWIKGGSELSSSICPFSASWWQMARDGRLTLLPILTFKLGTKANSSAPKLLLPQQWKS